MSKLAVDFLKRRWKHILAKCWVFFGTLIIVVAIVFSVFRALTPWARQYKTTVEAHLSKLIEQPVVIQSMETGWYWFHPVLQLNHISLTDDKAHTLKINKLLIGINLFSSLLHWKLQPGILYVDQTQLIFRQDNNHWKLEGLNLTSQDTDFGPDAYLPLFAWLSTQQKIVFRQASVALYFQDGSAIPLTHVNILLQNQGGLYRLKGSVQLARKIPTKLSMIAELKLNPQAFNQTSGQIYLAVESLVPAQWQSFLPHLPVKVEKGQVDASLWLDLKHGEVVESEGTIGLHHLVLNRDNRAELYTIPFGSMRLGWKSTKEGWDLNGSHVQLDMDGTKWPDNAFFIHHNESSQSNRIFVKHILLTPLLAMDIPWPEPLKSILEIKPSGQLHNTEFNLKANVPDYFLTGFTDLGWGEFGTIPAVSGLTGVVHWQPREGRFELDSHNTLIKPHELPPITFSRVNTALAWKPLREGIQLSIENFVLQNQDLTLTVGGILDDLEHFSSSYLHLVSQFSINHGEQWLKYIPSSALKEKLNQWLKQNIKQIAKASGQMTLDGKMADFPFDQAPGEFTILTYLTGVDLLIAPKWPLTRAINAYLHVDKRNLNVDIQHANLHGVVIDNMNLRMDDIGRGYETLLLHGKINATAEKILAAVFAMPLGEKLSRLQALDLRGLLGLDLKIEVPLYPENDDVLTRGEITFADNQVVLHSKANDLELENLTGLLVFDETGILDSTVTATLAGGPLSLHFESITKPKSATQVTIKGYTMMSALRDSLKLPALAVMSGRLNLDGVLTLPDNLTDWDNLNLRSTLQGVSVDLPKPLGKSSNAVMPITADIDFNDKKAMRSRIKYAGFTLEASQSETDEWSFLIKQKDITADLRYKPATNTLSGQIPYFHLDNSVDSATLNTDTITPGSIPNLHLTVQKFIYGDVDVGQIALDSKSTKTNLQIELLKVTSPSYELNIKGDWTKENTTDRTQGEAYLTISDLGKSLERWQIKPTVFTNKGAVSFTGGWQGGITNFSLDKVAGQIQVLIKNGRITDLGSATEEKLGLGKLLSIFSLQTIPRRLSLDFSDLAKEGYSFDQFKGNFQLKQGVMSTQDSEMDGPVAFVSMKGELNVVKRTCFFDIFVSPHIMASLPVVATIAGGPVGPIAGVATWVAIKIINKSMPKVTGYRYKVSGSWVDPVVEQLNIYKKRVKP